MDVKEKIQRIMESKGVNYERLKDLFDLTKACKYPWEKREWLLYVRRKARELRSADAYELIRQTYLEGARGGNFDLK